MMASAGFKAGLIAAVVALAACGQKQEAPASTPTPAAESTPAAANAAAGSPQSIDWREGAVDEAFAEAREKNRPVLLYWGAVWCPPCNQLKATVFRRADFIEQTRQFVAVHLDGDSPGAQRWGEFFGITGYPTLIVLRPDADGGRSEVMRLSGATDVELFPKMLALASMQTASVAQLRDRALATPAALSVDEWTLLANYGWDVDDQRLASSDQLAALLRQLGEKCPVPALKPRFAVLALAQAVDRADAAESALPASERAAAKSLVEQVIADAAQLKASHAELSYSGAHLVQAVTAKDSPERARLGTALTAALDRVSADDSLPVRDRLDTVSAELDLFHADKGEKAAPPAALADKVRQRVAWADAQSKTPYERQAVIGDAASLLESIGDRDAAEKLLLAELPRSQQPYYYMPHLSDLAEQRGDKPQAVDWLRRAYEGAEGPATRAQWGTAYVRGLIELTPTDARAIEAATSQVIGELRQHPDAYYQRTRTRLVKLDGQLRQWSGGRQAAVLQRLRTQMEGLCPALPADADEAVKTCRGWLAGV